MNADKNVRNVDQFCARAEIGGYYLCDTTCIILIQINHQLDQNFTRESHHHHPIHGLTPHSSSDHFLLDPRDQYFKTTHTHAANTSTGYTPLHRFYTFWLLKNQVKLGMTSNYLVCSPLALKYSFNSHLSKTKQRVMHP